jgi:hypothetical protein
MGKSNSIQLILVSIIICIMLNTYSLAQGLPYFGQDPPGMTSVRFAPGIFTEELHAPPIFSPEGDEVYYSLMNSSPGAILYTKLVDGIWTDPAVAPFSSPAGSDSPFISSNGTKLVFLSRQNAANGENIWVVEKNNGEWGTAIMLGNEVNQIGPHWQASIANNQNLYAANGDIYFSEYVNGSYSTAQKLGPEINTDDGYETSPFIAPDESYLIFGSVQGSSPYSDLFISTKQNDGSWSEGVNMEELNTGDHELYANVSPDGSFIMFLSGRSGILLPYWVDAQVIHNYITDVDDENNLERTITFELYQNYPNPFNPVTTIKYNIPSGTNVNIKIYDLMGKEIATLVNTYKPAGLHSITWDGKDKTGRELSSGIYYYQVRAGNQSQIRKMALIK